jgi:hypothetical protein
MRNLMTIRNRHNQARCSRGGTILIVTMWIILVLVGLVLVLGRSMRVEAICSVNSASVAQAQAIEQGAIQYVLAYLAGLDNLPTATDTPCEAIGVGTGGFWIITPDLENNTIAYGLTDEAGKINLSKIVSTPPNTQADAASLDVLTELFTTISGGSSPAASISDQLTACVIDWQNTSATAQANGAKSEYYLLLARPYACKDAPLQTFEELFLVKGFTKEILYGQDTNRNGILDAGETSIGDIQPAMSNSSNPDLGIYPYTTVYSATTSASSGPPVTPGLHININSAPRAVLKCLPAFKDNDSNVSTLINARASLVASGTTMTINDVRSLFPSMPPNQLSMITDTTHIFSADIVSVAGDGRAFRRCRIIVDNSISPPRVMFQQDLTQLGWPLDSGILAKLRSGKAFAEASASGAIQETLK